MTGIGVVGVEAAALARLGGEQLWAFTRTSLALIFTPDDPSSHNLSHFFGIILGHFRHPPALRMHVYPYPRSP